MPHADDDELALLALGEPQPGVEEHVLTCPTCRDELEALRRTVRTARDSEPSTLPPPPERVWLRIEHELGLGPAQVSREPGRDRAGSRRAVPRWAAGVAAALALAVAGAGLAVVTARHHRAPGPGSPGPTTATIALDPLRGATGSGRAVLEMGRTRTLVVDTHGLTPLHGAFYEVWLLEPGTTRTVALGTLDAQGRASLTVPLSVDMRSYRLVDISDEPDDGNPAHSTHSVLRGALPT